MGYYKFSFPGFSAYLIFWLERNKYEEEVIKSEMEYYLNTHFESWGSWLFIFFRENQELIVI